MKCFIIVLNRKYQSSDQMKMEVHEHSLKINRRHTEFCLKELKGIWHLENLGVEWSIILKWILKKQSARVWASFISGSEQGPVSGSFEHDNEYQNSTNSMQFLENPKKLSASQGLCIL